MFKDLTKAVGTTFAVIISVPVFLIYFAAICQWVISVLNGLWFIGEWTKFFSPFQYYLTLINFLLLPLAIFGAAWISLEAKRTGTAKVSKYFMAALTVVFLAVQAMIFFD